MPQTPDNAKRQLVADRQERGPERRVSPCIGEFSIQEAQRLRVRVQVLEKALRLLVQDVADYEAWQRPCYALDVARDALKVPGD